MVRVIPVGVVTDRVPSGARLNRQPAAWVILGIGALVSLVAWRSLSLELEHAARGNFNVVVTDSRHALESRMQSYELVLLGMQGLMQAKPDLDRAGFARYVDELAPERNASQARSFSYAKRVSHSDKERYQSAVGADASLHAGGYPRFATHSMAESFLKGGIVQSLGLKSSTTSRPSPRTSAASASTSRPTRCAVNRSSARATPE